MKPISAVLRASVLLDGTEPEGLSWEDRWSTFPASMLSSWRQGLINRFSMPELATACINDELPELPFKGGANKDSASNKLGYACYLAMWQGLRGEDLLWDPSHPCKLVCSRYGVTVEFTSDIDRLLG